MKYEQKARRVGTEHGNRHWAWSMAGGNRAWKGGTGHAWKGGLKR
jgi:hypothetical protein